MENSSFFNAIIQNGVPDRLYKADMFASYFSSFIGNGVFPNPSTNLQVVATDNNMTVRVKAGKAFINGYYYNNDDDLILTIDNADGILHRIDSIVIRLDFINREIKAYVKKGTFSNSPNKPELQRDDDRYELCLADIKINAGAIKITQSNINDNRLNSELCGLVTGTVDQVDTTTLYNQLQAHIEEKSIDMKTWIEEAKEYFSNWLSTTQTEYNDNFNSWFDEIKGTLEGDVAGNLLVKINELEEVVNNLDLVASKVTMSDGNTVEDAITANKTSIQSANSNISALQSSVNTNKTNIANNTNLANQALNKANEAFQRGDNVKNQLVDKLISEGLDVSTNNTFEELIGSIALGKKWSSGIVAITSTKKSFVGSWGSLNSEYYAEVRGLNFKPSCIVLYSEAKALRTIYNYGETYKSKQIVTTNMITWGGGSSHSLAYFTDSPCLIENGSFIVPVSSINVTAPFDMSWIAYE